jgi:hypothetical protein
MTVACTIFLAMTTVLFALLLQNRRSSQKVSAHTDVSAQMMLVFEKVRNEMRTGRIIGLSAQGALRYWRCRVSSEGVPILTAVGKPDWLPGVPADPDVAELSVQKGVLVRQFQGVRQPLAPVGKDGTLQFTWNPGIHTLSLSGAVGQKDAQDMLRNNYQTFVYDVYLTNRE